MSFPANFQVIIGFGNSKGQTSKILYQSGQKINRVNIKSHFGANPKVSIKQIPQINLSPFNQMIYKKRDQQTLKQLIRGKKDHSDINKIQKLKLIRQKCQKQYKELTSQLQFIKNCGQDQSIDKIIAKTKCSEKQAKKYLSKYSNNPDKAAQMLLQHKKIVQDFSVKFKVSKEQAKQILQANDYNMNVFV